MGVSGFICVMNQTLREIHTDQSSVVIVQQWRIQDIPERASTPDGLCQTIIFSKSLPKIS